MLCSTLRESSPARGAAAIQMTRSPTRAGGAVRLQSDTDLKSHSPFDRRRDRNQSSVQSHP
jgi:hypothetical protein